MKKIVWIGRSMIVVGWLAAVYGITGAVVNAEFQAPYVRYVGKALALIFLVAMPVVVGAGWLIKRFLPPIAQPVVQAALFATLVLTGVALPFVLGYGRAPDLPSALPRAYGRGLALALILTWLAAAVTILVRAAALRARNRKEARHE